VLPEISATVRYWCEEFGEYKVWSAELGDVQSTLEEVKVREQGGNGNGNGSGVRLIASHCVYDAGIHSHATHGERRDQAIRDQPAAQALAQAALRRRHVYARALYRAVHHALHPQQLPQQRRSHHIQVLEGILYVSSSPPPAAPLMQGAVTHSRLPLPTSNQRVLPTARSQVRAPGRAPTEAPPSHCHAGAVAELLLAEHQARTRECSSATTSAAVGSNSSFASLMRLEMMVVESCCVGAVLAFPSTVGTNGQLPQPHT